MNITQKCHEVAAAFFSGRSFLYAIDATLGKGRDALFAASLLADGGKVFGFDVQAAAVDASEKLFAEKGISHKAAFFNAGHENMKKLLPTECIGKVGCAFFNLGWLPNSDKHCITHAQTTLAAIGQAIEFIDKERGILSVLCYRGHDGGAQEYAAVLDFFKGNFGDAFGSVCDERNCESPVLLWVEFSGCKNCEKRK